MGCSSAGGRNRWSTERGDVDDAAAEEEEAVVGGAIIVYLILLRQMAAAGEDEEEIWTVAPQEGQATMMWKWKVKAGFSGEP